MYMKELTEYVTLVGALVAAGAGVWNLLLQMRGKSDYFFVRIGSISPSIDHETMLCVVSRSDHPIQLTDWGFIEPNGLFTSFRMGWETGDLHSEEIVSRGTFRLESFGQHFETGYVRQQMPFGVYAISATKRSPVITFDTEMPLCRRAWIRLRLLFQPSYLAW